MTLYEKLENNSRFEPVMACFIDKMSKDRILGNYFKNNHKMKHSVGNKMMLFFAYSKGCMNEDDMSSLKGYHKHMHLSIFDFERSVTLLREALSENGIDPALI